MIPEKRGGNAALLRKPAWLRKKAALGATVSTPTLAGPVELRIPPGARAGQRQVGIERPHRVADRRDEPRGGQGARASAAQGGQRRQGEDGLHANLSMVS